MITDQPTSSQPSTIRDLQVRWVAVSTLIPYARNAKTHPPASVSAIAASIKEFGWTNPIITDGQNGVIAGHGRLLAAQQLELERVPIIELAGLSEAQKRAYIIADNRIAEIAEWDEEMLKVELQDLRSQSFDLSLTGFDANEIEELLAQPSDAIPESNTAIDEEALAKTDHCCPKCGFKW